MVFSRALGEPEIALAADLEPVVEEPDDARAPTMAPMTSRPVRVNTELEVAVMRSATRSLTGHRPTAGAGHDGRCPPWSGVPALIMMALGTRLRGSADRSLDVPHEEVDDGPGSVSSDRARRLMAGGEAGGGSPGALPQWPPAGQPRPRGRRRRRGSSPMVWVDSCPLPAMQDEVAGLGLRRRASSMAWAYDRARRSGRCQRRRARRSGCRR